MEADQLTVVADVGYDSATEINSCLENDITPHVAGLEEGIQFCVQSTSGVLPETYANGRCVYLPGRNVAFCPMGAILYPAYYRKNRRCAIFANYKACSRCGQKCTIEKYKKFERIMKLSEFSKIYNIEGLQVEQITYVSNKEIIKRRKAIVEHPFGILKRILSSDHCLTKGFTNVRGEFSLSFLAFNMKRAINILGTTRLIHEIRGA